MNEDAVERIDAARLQVIASRIFAAAGAPHDVAERVAQLLVWSERVGHASHGVLRIPGYVERIRLGALVPHARGTIVRQTSGSVLVDGEWGFGQIAASLVTEQAIEKASTSGMAVAGAYHINHVGRLGDFTEAAAAAGLIAFAFVGGTPTGQVGNVAPYGGRKPVWGTNPLAIAIPGDERVFSLDFATSVIAGGKAASARARNVELEAEYLLDSEGRPTRDPWAVVEGGAIRPFGDHKGYALAFAVELLAGALIGAAAPELDVPEMHNGLLFMVLAPAAVGDVTRFGASVDAVVRRVKDCPPAEGFEEVLVPGELEARRREETDLAGIEVPRSVVAELVAVGRGLGIDLGL